MGFPNIFPREEKFFRFLEDQADHAFNSARHFKTFIETPGNKDAAEEIDTVRASSKVLATQITLELCRSFITPFDREDIQDLSDIFYKIPKIIHKVKGRVILHELNLCEGCYIKQADLIVNEATAMKKLVATLVSGKGHRAIVHNVNTLRELEQKGDDIHNEILSVLFKSDADFRDMILRRDISDMLETVVDGFRDAAGVILQIVLKHS